MHDAPPKEPIMTHPSGAFLRGGVGCLVAFLAIGFLFVLCGGSMHIDFGGVILLFVVGGIIGLIVYAVYRKGYLQGRREEPGPPQ
jgi:hypothetical protein